MRSFRSYIGRFYPKPFHPSSCFHLDDYSQYSYLCQNCTTSKHENDSFTIYPKYIPNPAVQKCIHSTLVGFRCHKLRSEQNYLSGNAKLETLESNSHDLTANILQDQDQSVTRFLSLPNTVIIFLVVSEGRTHSGSDHPDD